MEAIEIGAIYRAPEQARRQLLSMSGRTLEERGISRELLETGVGYWPWRSNDATVETRQAGESERRQAIHDLENTADREPAALGLSRSRNSVGETSRSPTSNPTPPDGSGFADSMPIPGDGIGKLPESPDAALA